MQKDIKFPIGNSDFAKIRQNGYYYIDKSNLIAEILKTESTEVTLITRPRRFGKTMGMSMLAEFFDIRKNSIALFEGLQISNNKQICKHWQNQCPTLFLTFKDVDGLTFNSAYGMLRNEIANLCKVHAYLGESDLIDKDDRIIFQNLKAGKADETQIKSSLKLLMRMMQSYYNKEVILLLDEYDVPIAKASSNGYYKEMLEIIKSMMSTALKDNSSLHFAIITGCLRIAKESIFTGTNNFVSDTISDTRLNEYFGFTEKEVLKILSDAECESHAQKVKEWYDGYCFGNIDIYCPWDVLNYINKVRINEIASPENFWEHTSDNAIIGKFLSRNQNTIKEKFEILMAGGYLKEKIVENLTYNILESSEDNVWSLLYLTGYLTKVKAEEWNEDEHLEMNQVRLKIPNVEIKSIMKNSIDEWFKSKAAASNYSEVWNDLWKADAESLSQNISDLLFDTISYHDYAESFYHAFLTGLFSSAGYIIESNYENGLGRSDIVIKDRDNRRAVVIEAKIAKDDDKLEKECNEALKQIETKQYNIKIQRSGYKNVLCFGAAFYQKSCLFKTKKI